MKQEAFLNKLKKTIDNFEDKKVFNNNDISLIYDKKSNSFLIDNNEVFKIRFSKNSAKTLILRIGEEQCRQTSNFLSDSNGNYIIYDDCTANKPDKINKKKHGKDSIETNKNYLKKQGFDEIVGDKKSHIKIFEFKDIEKEIEKIIIGLYKWSKACYEIRKEKRYEEKKKQETIITQKNNQNSSTSNANNHHNPSNLILYGPPGTGKTYRTVDMAVKIIKNEDYMSALECNEDEHKDNTLEFNKNLHKRIHFITFHQNYSYEEFVGGLRPDTASDTLKFKWAPGIFLKACAEAFKLTGIPVQIAEMYKADDVDKFLTYCEKPKDTEKFKNAPKVVLVIDEINRANISRVFGELITLIEDDKRIGGEHQLILSLPNGKKFGVPSNLVIVGTMNTADKSIALLDIALRRRFEFIQMEVNTSLAEGYKGLLEAINKKIEEKKNNQDFNIGHSYFMKKDGKDLNIEEVIEVMNKKVIPLLYEYFLNDKRDVKEVLEAVTKSNPELKLINVEEKNYSMLIIELIK